MEQWLSLGCIAIALLWIMVLVLMAGICAKCCSPRIALKPASLYKLNAHVRVRPVALQWALEQCGYRVVPLPPPDVRTNSNVHILWNGNDPSPALGVQGESAES